MSQTNHINYNTFSYQKDFSSENFSIVKKCNKCIPNKIIPQLNTLKVVLRKQPLFTKFWSNAIQVVLFFLWITFDYCYNQHTDDKNCNVKIV